MLLRLIGNTDTTRDAVRRQTSKATAFMMVATLVVNTHLVMAVEDNELNGVLAS